MNRTTVYPDWVQKYRTRGMTVKKKDNSPLREEFSQTLHN